MGKESFAWFDKIPKGAKIAVFWLAFLLVVASIAYAVFG